MNDDYRIEMLVKPLTDEQKAIIEQIKRPQLQSDIGESMLRRYEPRDFRQYFPLREMD